MSDSTNPAQNDDAEEIRDLSDLFDALFGSDALDELNESDTETQSDTNYVGHIPVELTIRYPKGHAYEAAQALIGSGSALSTLAFALSFADESVGDKLGDLGFDRDAAVERYQDVVDYAYSLDDRDNLALGIGRNPLALLDPNADLTTLIGQASVTEED